MKKRGLIVATIVMVLVLAVSLTTATYAWFTAANKSVVEGIDFAVGSDSDVLIGVKQTYSQQDTNKTDVNTDAFATGFTIDKFMWGDLGGADNYNYADNKNSTWSGGTTGLGHYINTGLVLTNISKAIGTGTFVGASSTSNTVDNDSWVKTNSIVKASASDTNDAYGLNTSVELAIPQEDYLDIVLGAKPARDNELQSINCIITVNPSDADLVLGMNAAIHVRYSLDGLTYYDCDIYDPTAAGSAAAAAAGVATFSEGTTKNDYKASTSAVSSAITANGDHTGYTAGAGYLGQGIAVNKGWASISIPIITVSGENTIDIDTITTIHIQVYIAGYDKDCNNDAIGVSSQILINFEGVKKPVAP